MNQDVFPSLASSDAIAGIVFQNQPQTKVQADNRQELEQSCIDLISQLQYKFATAKEMTEVDFVDESATIAKDMLASLQPFCEQSLTGKAADQAREEILSCMTMCDTFEEVLKTRSFGNAVMRTFWKAEESSEIVETRKQLGQSLVRACAATLYHSIILLGLDTAFGKQIDASAVVFINELNESW